MKITHSFYLGPALVEPLRNIICLNGHEIHIEPKIMQVLLFLVERQGEVCTRDELLSTAWPDTFPSDGVLAKAICTLRKALADRTRNPVFIETIPKVGYRLMVSVQPADAPEIEQDPASNSRFADFGPAPDHGPHQRKPLTYQIRLQTAALALFVLLSGVLTMLLFGQPSEAEQVMIYSTYEETEEGTVDSTVVIRTNLPNGERSLPFLRRHAEIADTTIEVIKIKEAP